MAGASVFSGLPKRYLKRNYRVKQNTSMTDSDNSQDSSMDDNEKEIMVTSFIKDTGTICHTDSVELVRTTFSLLIG